MKTNWFFTTLACMGLAAAAQANTITWTFQDQGTGDLGSSTVDFNSSPGGWTLEATSSGPNLFAKNAGGDETGLGLNGTTDNEINPGEYISLKVPTTPPSDLNLVIIGSVQNGESATVYWGLNPGDTTTLLGTLSGADGSVSIASLSPGYVTIESPTGNVLINSVSATVNIPDGGTTVALLGGALTLLGFARRKLIA